MGVIDVIGAQAFNAIRPDQRAAYAFEDKRIAVTRAISQMRAVGAKRIILLSHSGFDQDLLLAADVAGIDVRAIAFENIVSCLSRDCMILC